MKVEHQKVGTVDVLTPIGALVDQDGEAFSHQLQARVAAPTPRVVVCLKDVPYMDSTALEAMLTVAETLHDRANSLKLAELSPTCREILELTGLTSRFRIFKQTQDAVRSFL